MIYHKHKLMIFNEFNCDLVEICLDVTYMYINKDLTLIGIYNLQSLLSN